MPYEEVLAEMPKVTDNQQESIYLPLADYLNAGIVRPSEDYFRVLPDGTLVPIVEDGVTVILQEVKTVQLYENGNFIVNPDEGYGAIGKVLLEINVPTLDTSDATIVEGDILEGKFGYANGQKVYGNIKNNGSKSVILDADNAEYSLKGYYSGGSVKITIQNPDAVTPTRETQIVEAEDGKVLGRVTVNPIPNDYLIPDKTLNITANGTYPDIREYSEVIVNVEATDSPLPTEVSTEAEMTALLTSGEVGGVYKYTGTTGTYENGALYVLEEEAAATKKLSVTNNGSYEAFAEYWLDKSNTETADGNTYLSISGTATELTGISSYIIIQSETAFVSISNAVGCTYESLNSSTLKITLTADNASITVEVND